MKNKKAIPFVGYGALDCDFFKAQKVRQKLFCYFLSIQNEGAIPIMLTRKFILSKFGTSSMLLSFSQTFNFPVILMIFYCQ